MSEKIPQDLKHHARTDAWFMAAGVVVYANVVVAIVSLVRAPNLDRAWILVLSLALAVLALRIRQYPLKAQDRLIRLEERLRLQALAPAEGRAQIDRLSVDQLSVDQLIGLRFAADDEVVALAHQALAENLNRKQIKERIRTWRADDWRV
ncbi:MAG TPA: DUF6526 family protein [Acidobacteriaceae bacterium]|jgi:hypothetical protein|nr:DUF6526 family protein [Acidobacteriaceae bacterium]